MDPMRVDVREILADLGASIHVDTDVSLQDMEFGDALFAAAGPAHASVTLSNSGAGVVAYGTIQADFQTNCSRCLEPFVLHVSGDVEGFYTRREKAQELSEDQEWFPLGDGDIDLAPALDSALRIELPIAPLHSENCKGICPMCGCDWNTETCSCDTSASVSGPFDSLKDLLAED